MARNLGVVGLEVIHVFHYVPILAKRLKGRPVLVPSVQVLHRAHAAATVLGHVSLAASIVLRPCFVEAWLRCKALLSFIFDFFHH